MSVYLEDHLPVVKHNGLNTAKDVTVASGSLTLTTGNVVLSANGAGISFTGTGTNGGVLTNLYNAAATTLSGTQKDIKILIGTVPYYFTVYPSKA